MTGSAALRRSWRQLSAKTVVLALSCAAAIVPASNAAPMYPSERVRGFFCNEMSHSVDFLMQQTKGENEEIAANSVNKALAKFSCAYYMALNAIYTGEHTVMKRGMIFKLHSYVFLPERVERWSGSAVSTLQVSPYAKHDV